MLHFDAVPAPVRALLLDLVGRPALQCFALGGGTSLALRFGHRLSVDLDFFTDQEFAAQDLFEELGIKNGTITGQARNSLSADVGGIKLDLLRHAYPWLEPFERFDDITLISLPDLAAMKLNAVANRGAKKDFYDIARLLDWVPLGEMIRFFERKYPHTDPFTVIRSLAWFEEAELDPDPVTFAGIGWEDVKQSVRDAVAGYG